MAEPCALARALLPIFVCRDSTIEMAEYPKGTIKKIKVHNFMVRCFANAAPVACVRCTGPMIGAVAASSAMGVQR